MIYESGMSFFFNLIIHSTITPLYLYSHDRANEQQQQQYFNVP